MNKQTNKQKYKIEFQNSIVRLSFLCRITVIKIAWLNPCLSNTFDMNLYHKVVSYCKGLQ